MRSYKKGSRIDILKFIKSRKRSKNYLEIGCHKNEVFNEIVVSGKKVGVDPNRGGNVLMTSDDFFDQNNTFFDLIFLDGLHEYEQLKRDVENSLNFLSPGGVIMLHDMLPLSASVATRKRNTRVWNGDVWRLNFNLIENENFNYNIINMDMGCGIISKVKRAGIYFEEHITSDFNYFESNLDRLPIVDSYADIVDKI